jgi:hypothetical protein
MRSSIFRRLTVVSAIALMALGTTACDSGDDTTPTTPTLPTPNVTETFAGSININGAATFTFPTTSGGAVNASLRALTPDSTIQVSLALGTWNGVNCQVVLNNDRASQGGSITGNVSGAGTLCVRISDIGQITQQTGFEIVVIHP